MNKKRFKKIYLEITNSCNLSCSFCIKNRRVIKYLSLEEFKIYSLIYNRAIASLMKDAIVEDTKVEVINNDGTTSKELVTIQDLVKNAVHTYALESYENIVITDLDDCAVELLDYKVADKGMFIYDISIDPSFKYYTSQMVFENSPLAERFIESAPKKEGSSELDPDYYIPYAQFELDGAYYRIVKFVQYGDTAGYRETDLTYAGTLIVNAGNPVS